MQEVYHTLDELTRHQLVELWTAYGILQAIVIILLVARCGHVSVRQAALVDLQPACLLY
jgi:hypothetical protein